MAVVALVVSRVTLGAKFGAFPRRAGVLVARCPGPAFSGFTWEGLFDGDGFGEVSGFVDVFASGSCDFCGKDLHYCVS